MSKNDVPLLCNYRAHFRPMIAFLTRLHFHVTPSSLHSVDDVHKMRGDQTRSEAGTFKPLGSPLYKDKQSTQGHATWDFFSQITANPLKSHWSKVNLSTRWGSVKLLGPIRTYESKLPVALVRLVLSHLCIRNQGRILGIHWRQACTDNASTLQFSLTFFLPLSYSPHYTSRFPLLLCPSEPNYAIKHSIFLIWKATPLQHWPPL